MADPTPFERHTRACQSRLAALGADAAVLSPGHNLYYATGYTESPGERHFLCFVPAEGDPTFLVPAMSGEQVREAAWISDVRTWADEADPLAATADVAADLGLDGGRVLLDDTMWARFVLDLQSVLPDATFGLASEAFGPLRARKDDAELDAMRRAADIADAVVEDVRALGDEVVGRTEAELAREIDRRLADRGGEGVAFETIVAAGSNGAKPHHYRSDRRIEAGDPVVLDFGTVVDGYLSDQTRTLVFGDEAPPEEFERVFETVREAQAAGVDAVEPGVTAGAVDRTTRDVVESAGYGDRFVHRTGHGVGLDIHEAPYIVEGNERELQPGMVFSVEPGVYLDGRFGVRIEDLVVVTEEGCERLNRSSREWRV